MPSPRRPAHLEPKASKMDGVEWRFLSADEMAMPAPLQKPEQITKEDLETIVQQRLDHSLMLRMEADPSVVGTNSISVSHNRLQSGMDGGTSVSFELPNDGVSLLSDAVGGPGGGDGTARSSRAGVSRDDIDENGLDDQSFSSDSSASSNNQQKDEDEPKKGGADASVGGDGGGGEGGEGSAEQGGGEDGNREPGHEDGAGAYETPGKDPRRKKRTEKIVEEAALTPAQEKVEKLFNDHQDAVTAKKKQLEEEGVAAGVGAGAPIVLWRPPNEVRITNDVPAVLLENAIAVTTANGGKEDTGEMRDVEELSPEDALAELKAREKDASEKANAEATTMELLAQIRRDSPDIPNRPSAGSGKRRPVPPPQGSSRRFGRSGGRGGAVRSQQGQQQEQTNGLRRSLPQPTYKAVVVQHPKPFVVSTIEVDKVERPLYGMWFVPAKYWQVSRAPGQLSAREQVAAGTGDGHAPTSEGMVGEASGHVGGSEGRRATTRPPPVKAKDRTPAESYWEMERRLHDNRKEKLDRVLPSLFISRQYTQWLADPSNKIERTPAWARELAKRIAHQQHHHHHHQTGGTGGGGKPKK